MEMKFKKGKKRPRGHKWNRKWKKKMNIKLRLKKLQNNEKFKKNVET